MILIADSGSTKCNWAMVDTFQKSITATFGTKGLNPFILSKEEIITVLKKDVLPNIKDSDITQLYFYGAGVIFDKAELIKECLMSTLGINDVEVASDMEGARKATVGDGSGIVCILGTGSNSTLYLNGMPDKKVPALGYILGDEGSGSVMGRMLVSDILKGVAPSEITEKFHKEYNLSQQEILDAIYKRPFANRFLAQFARFISKMRDNLYIQRLIRNSFHNFFERNISQYPKTYSLSMVGSIAKVFEEYLHETALVWGYRINSIIDNPLENLCRYHLGTLDSNQEKASEEEFIKITEKHSLYDSLETMSIHDILHSINNEDHKVARAVHRALPKIEELLQELAPRMKRGGRIFYIGAGTSGRLGVLDASEVPPTFGMPPTVVIGLIAGGDTALRCPVEGAEDDTQQGWLDIIKYNPTKDDTVIGIAASGTTPYVIGALRDAKENGLLTASISSNPNSPLSKEANIAIETVVGPEFVSGSSRMKSGTAQKLVCNMITTCSMIQLGRVKGNKMVNMQLSNKKLIDRGTRMIVEETGMEYDKAKALLLIHGSVKAALDSLK